jgi:hypothetical protein
MVGNIACKDSLRYTERSSQRAKKTKQENQIQQLITIHSLVLDTIAAAYMRDITQTSVVLWFTAAALNHLRPP